MTNPRSPIRVLRAALFAAVCVTLSAIGHASQSAHDVPAGSLLLAFGATGALAWLAAGRRRGPVAMGTGLLAVQGVLHVTFAGGLEDHHHAHEGAVDSLSSGMLAAHVLAAAVCALWLARGEAAFLGLARTAFTPLRPPLTAVRLPAAPRPPRPRPRTADRLHHGVVLAHTLSRRGPPVLAAPRAKALGTHG
ncbi:hypothetical protein ACFPM3_02380 [Streptomyces coeruleoprunus]|uniref:MFS transporter n=1 Tax=Streptomyces coeruleoprunus TaxID=285563 RepID=A0ABV9X9T3_9ACTN